ncbi:MAG: carboxymuconolactone decarboxylase family protein [Pseudomonadota bacterium]
MAEFKVHTLEDAPEASKPLLEDSRKSFGMVPNLHALMAESPQVLEAYKTLSGLFSSTALTAEERNVVWLAVNVEHNCHYCVPAHTAIAKSQGVSDEVIEALRSAAPLPDVKLEALRSFTLSVVRNRGVVPDTETEAFFAAGYDQRAVLEVILGVTHKVLSNYVNHFGQTPIDPAFASFAWEPQRS